MKGKTMPLSFKLAQSFAKAVSTNDVNYVMLKRKNNGSIPPLNLKRVFCVFSMLDKFLGGDGLAEAKSEFWITEEDAKQDVSDETLEEIIASITSMPEDRKEKWTIIVFSETFFSDDPWDSAELEKVMKLCRTLTEKYNNLVISVNFLHKYQGVSNTPSRRAPINEGFVATADKAKLLQNRLSDFRFSNCSLIVWNGVPISCYRKTTYLKEDDELVASGYGYDFGDWKSYPTLELAEASDDHKEFAALFNSGRKQIVASRICSDLNFILPLSKSIKLLIIQADDAPPNTSWIRNVRNAIICYCDADRYTFTVTLSKNNVKCAARVNASGFIGSELHCVIAAYYGDGVSEVVDVGCC
jgi:predicted amidohydrolase